MSKLPPQDFLNFEKRFIYVDAYHEPASGSRTKWKRIKIEDLQAFAKECHHYNVFATIQQFAIYKKTDNEEQYLPLYFDFDAHEPFTFKDVQEDVEKLKEYFFRVHGLDKTEIRFYFSGNRGMHVLVNPISLGIEPHPELTYIYKNIALYLKDLLKLNTLDPIVYSIRRVWRLPNSVHKTSGCYKIELDASELLMNEEEIRKLAHSPREPFYAIEDYIGLIPNESLKSFYGHFFEFYKKQNEINKLKPQKPILKSEVFPICVKDLLENSIKKSGTRNSATFFLSCYFKDQGYTKEKTFEILYDWAQKIPKELANTRGKELEASTKFCIDSTFDDKSIGKNYHFICSAMRSLGTECNFDKCIVANIKDQEPEKVIDISLAEASDGAFVGKKLSCKVMIVGKDTSPYLSPGRVQFSCEETNKETLKEEKCLNCFIGQSGDNRIALDLPKTAQFILETINCTTFQQLLLLKKLYLKSNAGCAKSKVEVLEYRNIEEVELNPGLENSHKDASEDSDYVARKGFYVGHNLDVNQEFNVIGYVIPEPKTQHAVHIFDDAKASETSLTSFKMTSEIRKRLEIFQVEKNKTVNDKFNDIYNDLERNIFHIWQRRAMIVAMDLVYHSILRFELNGELLQRGWTETMIIGDSGQAKCIVGNSYILTEKGMLKLEDICNEKKANSKISIRLKVASLNKKDYTSHFYVNGKSKTKKVITRMGFSIEGTKNHPIITIDENGDMKFKKLNDCKKGDFIAIAKNNNLFGRKKLKDEEARILGYLLACGYLGKQFSFCKIPGPIHEDFKQCLKKLGLSYSVSRYKCRKTLSIRLHKETKLYFMKLGLKDKITAKDKVVPDLILQSNKKAQIQFLKSLFECDGYYSNKRLENIGYSSRSEILIEQLHLMLSNFGIIAMKTKKFNKKYKRYYHYLFIRSNYIDEFMKKISFITKHKKYKNEKVRNTNIDIIPNMRLPLKNLLEEFKKKKTMILKKSPLRSSIKGITNNYNNGSAKRLKKILNKMKAVNYLNDYKYLKNLIKISNVIFWDKIVDIQDSEAETFDFMIPKSHIFVANSIYNHNSDLFLKLRNHYNLGTRVSGEGARRTGLAWTWQQTAKRWFIKFGIIPNNDRRLVCIDEAAGMAEEELEKLTDLRESGIADATGGPIPARAHARTRLIWMSNARNGQSLRTFMFPVEAIQTVFKKTEDIRRIDFAVGVVTGVISDDIIHQNAQDMPAVHHKYTSDLCHELVLWAWTRKPNEVIITKEASQAIKDTALAFGRKYSARIPIVETAVQRIKIARLAVAAAARVFSISPTDKEGNILIVLPEHVEFVRDFLERQYDDPIALDYLNYTVNNRLDSDSIYDKAFEDYSRLEEVNQLNSVLMTTKYWVKNDLGDMLGIERDKLQDIMKILARHRLIEKVRGQYRMTTAGIDFVKKFDKDKRRFSILSNEQTHIKEEEYIKSKDEKDPFDLTF